MKCVRIGYGEIAFLHEKKLSELGVRTVGVIEKNASKCQLAQSQGFHILSSYQEAMRLNPFFWDICTCTATHVDIIEKIVHLSPDANIIVEKPICNFSNLIKLKNVLRQFYGKIFINENYQMSQVTKVINEQIDRYGIKPTKIISEMTKNRSYDISNGRFIDNDNFVFGYEGPHILTNILNLGKDYAPKHISNVSYQDMIISRSSCREFLKNQGVGKISYISKNGTEVIMYTSMNGKIGFLFPHSPYINNYIPVDDCSTRYRILAVEEVAKKLCVVGYFEPIISHPRATGMVVVLSDNKIIEKISPIEDDSIRLSMENAINYFKGSAKNLCTLSQAIYTVEILHMMSKFEVQEEI